MVLVEWAQKAQESARQWLGFAHRHRAPVLAGVGGVLALSSAAAFALAYEGPVAQLPQPTWISVALPDTASAQAEQLADSDQTLYTTAHVRSDDSVESLLRRLQVTDPDQLRSLSSRKDLRALVTGDPGRVVSAEVTSLGELVSLQGRLPGLKPVVGSSDGAREWRELQVHQAVQGWSVQVNSRIVHPELRLASGTVNTTFYAAADAANMPNSVASQLVQLFSGEVDFRRSLRKGDRFSAVYRVYTAGGQVIDVGRVLSASFDQHDGHHQAVWFGANGNKDVAGYYAPNGDSLHRAFLLSPLPYDRITSGWGWRENPVKHFHEFHKGIDLAIPVGTPVKTIADGRVVYAGWGTGYGKYVKVQHPGGFATIYSHLSAFKVHVGEQVKQGEVVALTGNTGWSTGPHLYFQFFVHGTPVNPLDIAQYSPRGKAVPAADRAAFVAATAQPLRVLALSGGGVPVSTAAVATVPGKEQHDG